MARSSPTSQGNVTVNSLPSPRRLLTSICPPIIVASRLADRQPQPGAFVAARQGRVDLTEGLEQLRQVFGRAMPMPVSATADAHCRTV
jgi:hypothetical protein